MLAISHFWTLVLGTIVGLLPIINPLAGAPTFLAITEGDSAERRMEQLGKACLYMVLILVGFLVGGTFIMAFFGISIPGLRIAGGMLVVGIGWRMLMGAHGLEEHANPEARAKADVSFSPLAMPMLSGPGSIAVTLGFTSLARRWWDYGAIILGIMAVAAITYVVLRASTRVVRVIGANGMNALTRIMGFMLVCVGVQFVVNGLVGVVSDPAVVHAIRGVL
jgi:multiple antibiotic resistance protein